MKISGLQILLEEIKQEYGDLEVRERTSSDVSMLEWDLDESDISIMTSRDGTKFLNFWAY